MNSHSLPTVFLCGFMGCGKTTLGRQLAVLLNRRFIDLDEEIEKTTSLPVHKIFSAQGEESFRNHEKNALRHIVSLNERLVVALGGGTVCDDENLELIKKSGLLIYIRIPILTLAERLEPGTANRPLLAGLTGEQLVDNIEKRMLEREKFYEHAHLSLNGINLGAPQLLRFIQGAVRSGNI